MARSILIVEDESDVAPLEIALASLGDVGVHVVSDARAALRFLEQNGHSIAGVITDLNLPHVDGFELVTAIRSNSKHARLPIIVVSGNANPDVPKRALQIGADAFFAKPYSPAEIRQTLARLLHVSPSISP
ncbi:MAG TPA: response regulator [Bryobacteraceae bacterium]|jgi:CheY-like chemotaxis protein|nr:response regulator [Bryobacteraceae bacterium]